MRDRTPGVVGNEQEARAAIGTRDNDGFGIAASQQSARRGVGIQSSVATVQVLAVRHVTTYRYRQPVSFGEHRLMLRPRESFDQWLIESKLVISPEPADLRWTQDVFGNAVAYARFRGRATELVFDYAFTLEHDPVEPHEVTLEESARTYPFTYGAEDMPDLLRSIERQHADPERALTKWARGFVSTRTHADPREILAAMTHAIRADFTYLAREKGTQSPIETLRLRQGTCRDFAILMIEAARALGFAARFVSGYLYSPARDRGGVVRQGAGSTHAWVRIYLPGPGWIEYDPTNGLVGNRDLIRVAIARDPAQAVPLTGAFIGFPADFRSMEVTVDVTARDAAAQPPVSPASAPPVFAQPVPSQPLASNA